MSDIINVVEQAFAKYSAVEMPKVKREIASNLELRLVLEIDFSKPYKEAKKDFLRRYLNDILVLSFGNISAAARKAQVNRRHLHRIINDLELQPEAHKQQIIKPAEYMKDNVQVILEDSLSKFGNADLDEIYSHIEDLTERLADNIETYSYNDAIDLFEKQYLEHALRKNGFDIMKTAEAIQVSQRTLYRKISKLNIAVV